MISRLALAGCIAICTLVTPLIHAQSDVSIKTGQAKPGVRRSIGRGPNGALRAVNLNLRALVAFAFDLRSYQLIGGPDWMDADRFDIDIVDVKGTADEDRAKLVAVLAERFNLKFHRESREMPVYVLKSVTNGEGPGNGVWLGVATPSADGRTLAAFATDLGKSLDRAVFDATNLAGKFDLLPNFTTFPLPVITPPDIGLKLDSAEGSVEVFVIDGAGKPSLD